MDTSNLCKFKDHSWEKVPIYITHFCLTCSLGFCRNCLLIHNSNPDYFSHKIVRINENEKNWKKKLEEIEKDKPIINMNNKEGEEIVNNKKDTYAQNLNGLNNVFRNIVLDWYNKYNELENIENYIDKQIENKENINYTETKKIISDIYECIINRQKEIKDLVNTGNKLEKFKQLSDLNTLSICSNINNYSFNRIICDKDMNIKQLEEKNNNEKNIISNSSNNIKNSETVSIQKREELIVDNINKKVNEEKNDKKKMSDSTKSTKNKSDSKFRINLGIISNNNEQNEYINKKTKRKIKTKECLFCDCCSNDSHKKRKTDNFNLNPPNKTNQLKKIESNKENNKKTKIGKNRQTNFYLNLFNFHLDIEKNLCLILLDINLVETCTKCFKRKDIIYKEKFPNYEKFPFLFSKIININNSAFIIGGKSNWDSEEQGNNLVLRINYVKNSEDNKSLGKIICTPLVNTKFCHYSHNLIYSKLYNTIFVLSGHEQKKCEFGKLDREKKTIKEWKEFNNIRASRENAISFLLNEKYIFLIGGQGQNSYNYDVFDISSLFDSDKALIWKTYNFNINQFNKQIFNIQNAGIVYSFNKIFVLGGIRSNEKEYLNWKIEFINESDDNIRIEKIILLKNNWFENHKGKGVFYFYGQQIFHECDNCFFNIDFEGECKIFEKEKFKELI